MQVLALTTPHAAGRKDVQLKSIKLGGKQLAPEQYERTDKKLIIKNLPSGSFEAEIEVHLKPQVWDGWRQCLAERIVQRAGQQPGELACPQSRLAACSPGRSA